MLIEKTKANPKLQTLLKEYLQYLKISEDKKKRTNGTHELFKNPYEDNKILKDAAEFFQDPEMNDLYDKEIKSLK